MNPRQGPGGTDGMRERTLSTNADSAALYVHEWGDPADAQAVALVFWHALGSATSGSYLAEIAPDLVRRHRLRIIAPDAPGFGRSPARPPHGYRLEATADLLEELIDRLGLDAPILAGHSWGGVVASVLAARRPGRIRGLVLLDSGHLDYPDAPGFDPSLTFDERVAELSAPGRRLPAVRWEQLVSEVRDELPRWAPAVEDLLRGGVGLEDGRVREIPSPEVKAAIWDALGRHRVSATWDAIASGGFPVLLATATLPEQAASLNAEAAARYVARVPRTTWVPIDGARHDLLLDAGPRVADAIGAWLVDLGSSPPSRSERDAE